MTIKPILFNTEMVRALLDGRKTVTRRVITPQPKAKLAFIAMGHNCGKWSYPGEDAWKYWEDEAFKRPNNLTEEDLKRYWTPPYHTEDILYVRETWAELFYVDEDGYTHCDQSEYFYAADGTPDITLKDDDGFELDDQRFRWRPSIHMPREAARIFLRVTNVRVERLQEISNQDVVNEGVLPKNLRRGGCKCTWAFDGCLESPCANRESYSELCHSATFAELWGSTIKPADRDKYGWDANPWVWVIEFERTEKPC